MSGSIKTTAATVMTCLAYATLTAADETSEVNFTRDIRPILSNRCFQCHGPDEEQRAAGLRLDQLSGATQDLGGYSAIVPGKPDESELLARIRSTDESLRMPPPESGGPLSENDINVLEQWIAQGASFAKHWSFQPIERPPLPDLEAIPEDWNRHPIDLFIYRRLAEAGIEPSTEACRNTLMRRVYLDLLGLPPTLEQLNKFLFDDRPEAYERMLDDVLSNPHFGERWGRHWLDQARYADSHGYTNDNARSIWPYRDWVIGAFNDDLPFDRFTIEQLSGDLLKAPTLEQRIATGFHRNTLINSEGGTKADQFRDEQVKDRVDTTGLVWMGLTVGCAKCHAHKFDPLSQEEYYQLYAFFNSTTDQNSVTPTLQVPSREQRRELQELERQRQSLRQQIDSDPNRSARQAVWEAELLASVRASSSSSGEESGGASSLDPYDWEVLELSAKSDQSTVFQILEDRSVLARGRATLPEEYEATALSPLTKIRSVRLEALTDESLPKNGPGRAGNGNFVLSEFWFRTGDGRELRFSRAGAEHSQPKYSVTQAIDGKTDTGWAINGAPEGTLNRNRTAWFVLPEALEVESKHALVFKLQFHVNDNYSLGRFRISVSEKGWVDRPDPKLIARLLEIPAGERSDEQQARIDRAFVQSDPILGKLDTNLTQVTKELDSLRRQIPTTMVLEELDDPRPTHVHVRGDFLRPGEPVAPDVPRFLPPLGSQPSVDRRDLARWLVDRRHPLTARVRVNRIWMRLFGQGLVETENDFGIQGSFPTHPDLLDWLATEFMRRGWSTKDLLRCIMTSATYRQQSHHRPELDQKDPRNLWLGRQNRIRVEAEIVRDLALAASGALSAEVGGPSVFPPQPEGVYAFTQRKKNWTTSRGADRFRRGMYTFFYRSAPYPMLSTFDVPKFNQVCTRRDRSNTPLQSLTMANSEALMELAEMLGRAIVADSPGEDNAQRLEIAFQRCLSRKPTAEELERLEGFLQTCRQRMSHEQQVWTALARVLINLDEFVTRE